MGASKTPAGKKRRILESWKVSEMHVKSQMMIDNMVAFGNRIFQQDGMLLRLEESAGELKFRVMNLAMLRHEVSLSTIYTKQYISGSKPEPDITEVRIPDYLIDDIFSTTPLPFPEVKGILTHPTMNGRGDFITKSGYDPTTGWYINAAEAVLKRLEGIESLRPSWAQVREAVDTILDPLCDFPFEEGASKAAAIALMLTLLLRPMINGPVPAASVQAPSQENGKTLLAETCITAVLGATPANTPLNFKNDEEVEKRLFAAFLSGDEVIFVDNIGGRYEIANDFMESAVTTMFVKGRVLGKTELRKVYSGMPFVFTSINPRFGRDMGTRTYPIILIQPTAALEERTYKYSDPKKRVAERHADIIYSLFVLVQNWAKNHAFRDGSRKMAHFDEWSRKIGGILESCGFQDFLGNLQKFKASADEEGSQVLGYAVCWHLRFGETEVTVDELLELGEQANLIDAAKSVQSRRTRLGKLQGQYEGRKMTDGDAVYEIQRARFLDGKQRWKVVKR